jgi:hypothetical protein
MPKSKKMAFLGSRFQTFFPEDMPPDPACAGWTHSLDNISTYIRKNAQVVTGLQTSCYEYAHDLSTSCVCTASL